MSDAWDDRFRSLCDHVAAWSEDRDFKVGCVIVGNGHTVLSLGWNGLPRGVSSADPMRLDRESGEKFYWVEHAERNTIYNAARNGVALEGARLYVNRFPCADCARSIVQSGIVAVHCPPIPANDGRLDHSFQVSAQILREAGVDVETDAGGGDASLAPPEKAMVARLRDALCETAAGWKDDLPPDWRAVLARVEHGSADVAPELELEPWEPIFPARKGRVFPGAPEGAHMLRAFDGVRADAVRVVLLGQDPYPEPAAASGRAFEIGNALVWRDLDRMFSKSIRAWTQMLMAARHRRPELAAGFAAWAPMLDDIEAGTLDIDPPARMADRQERQGVLLLNSALTLSRFRRDVDPHQARGHVPFWAPVIQAVLRHVARAEHPVVFVALGDAAAGNLDAAGLLPAPAPHLSLVLPHPAFADDFLACPNPFLAANAHLHRMGAPPIDW